jgi:hypothetical protein
MGEPGLGDRILDRRCDRRPFLPDRGPQEKMDVLGHDDPREKLEAEALS